jgi:hypothetical protein
MVKDESILGGKVRSLHYLYPVSLGISSIFDMDYQRQIDRIPYFYWYYATFVMCC